MYICPCMMPLSTQPPSITPAAFHHTDQQ
jgi:hypothetical protein